MFLPWRHICEGDPLAVRGPIDKRDIRRADKSVVSGRHSGRTQFSLNAAKRGHNIDSSLRAGHAVKGDLRAVGRPCRSYRFRGMLRQAEKSFAPKGLHVQIEALGPGLWITVPRESDSGAIGRESRRSRLSGQSRERNGSQVHLPLRGLGLGPKPSKDSYGCEGDGRNGEYSESDLQPDLSEVDTRFDPIASSIAGVGEGCER